MRLSDVLEAAGMGARICNRVKCDGCWPGGCPFVYHVSGRARRIHPAGYPGRYGGLTARQADEAKRCYACGAQLSEPGTVLPGERVCLNPKCRKYVEPAEQLERQRKGLT